VRGPPVARCAELELRVDDSGVLTIASFSESDGNIHGRVRKTPGLEAIGALRGCVSLYMEKGNEHVPTLKELLAFETSLSAPDNARCYLGDYRDWKTLDGQARSWRGTAYVITVDGEHRGNVAVVALEARPLEYGVTGSRYFAYI
jgi:hypothetical protein